MITFNSIDRLVEIISAYGAKLTGVDVKSDNIVYYLDLSEKDLGMSVEATMSNLYAIFKTFTYGENQKEDSKLELKYQLIKE